MPQWTSIPICVSFNTTNNLKFSYLSYSEEPAHVCCWPWGERCLQNARCTGSSSGEQQDILLANLFKPEIQLQSCPLLNEHNCSLVWTCLQVGSDTALNIQSSSMCLLCIWQPGKEPVASPANRAETAPNTQEYIRSVQVTWTQQPALCHKLSKAPCNCTILLKVPPEHSTTTCRQLFKNSSASSPVFLKPYSGISAIWTPMRYEGIGQHGTFPFPSSHVSAKLDPSVPRSAQLSGSACCISTTCCSARCTSALHTSAPQHRLPAPLREGWEMSEHGRNAGRKKRKSCSSLRAGWNGELSS